MAKRRARSEPPPTEIASLVLPHNNARRRTDRGREMIRKSLVEVGPARSILIDEDNIVRAGAGTVEGAIEAGITKLLVVDAPADTLVAVRRRGWSPEQKRNASLYDNRSAELAEWVPEQLADDLANHRPLSPFFSETELKRILQTGTGTEPTVTEVQTGDVKDRFWIAVAGPLQSQAVALQRIRELMKDVEGVTVELGTVPSEAWG